MLAQINYTQPDILALSGFVKKVRFIMFGIIYDMSAKSKVGKGQLKKCDKILTERKQHG